MLDWLDLIALILVIVAAVLFYLQLNQVQAPSKWQGLVGFILVVLAVGCMYWTTRMIKDTVEENFDWAKEITDRVNALPSDPKVPPPEPPLWE